MALLKNLFRPGLLSNIGAHGYAQVIQIGLQLLFVPLFAHRWGLEDYGIWLTLFTIPGYLVSIDLGFTRVSTNEMIASVATNRRDEAVAVFQALRIGISLLCIFVLALAGLLIFVVFPDAMGFAQSAAHGQANLVALLLVAYGLATLQCQTVLSAFQAIGLYGPSGYVSQTIVLIEGLSALVLVLAGETMVEVASAYLAVRLAGTLALSWWLHREAPWLSRFAWVAVRPHLARLARPAIATMALPAAYAAALQGQVVVIGAFAGMAAVPVFTAVRTATRMGVQFTNIVSLASMPNFTAASATGAEERKAELVALSIAAALAVLLPAFAVLATLGPWLIGLWTVGVLVPTRALMAVMSLVMLLDGLWHAPANFLLSINEHGRFSWFFLMASLATLALAIPLVREWGPTGAALSLAVLHAAMLAWVFAQARRAGILELQALRTAPARLVEAFRTRLLGQAAPGIPRSTGDGGTP